MKEVTGVREALSRTENTRIVITTHHKPDADALGSSLGLWNFLKEEGFEEVTVISPTDYPRFLHWMPGNEHVINFEEYKEICADIILRADVIFCLDFNDLKRINDMEPMVRNARAIKVLIDHHTHPTHFEDIGIWSTEASSTCELVYQFLKSYKGQLHISRNTANCLYAGLVADTGSFRFNSVTPNTHLIASELINAGAENARVHELLFDNNTENRLRFLGYALLKKLEIIPEYRTALMVINRQELTEFNLQTGDTEGLVNFGLSIEAIELSALIIDRTKLVKMSFRSRGGFPANQLAREHFSGGGHFNAAGGQSEESLEATVARFRKVLPEYAHFLNHTNSFINS